MARVTVEDCLEKIPNRFELVMVAAKRARELALTGANSFVDWENDKATVVALREIADGFVDQSILTKKPGEVTQPEPEPEPAEQTDKDSAEKTDDTEAA